MSRNFISGVIIVLVLVTPLAVFVAPDRSNLENERRRIASFPDIPQDMRSENVKAFFKGIDPFVSDHFPLRNSFLVLSSGLHNAVGANLDMDKCYRGKENWLFLGNSYDWCVDKLQGSRTLPERYILKRVEHYRKLRDLFRNGGTDFVMFIGPNKSSVYPEYLPPVVVPAAKRYISLFVTSLRDAGVKIYDPTDRLVSLKSTGLLYYRTDTHWNYRGAYEAFVGFGEYAGLPELPSCTFTLIAPKSGDLVKIGGYKKFPLSVGDTYRLNWSVPQMLEQRGNIAINAKATSNKTVWVFGDSFTEALRPYIMATFKETRFFVHTEFDKVIASEKRLPDMVIWEIVERRLI
jgi:hypothetical protein